VKFVGRLQHKRPACSVSEGRKWLTSILPVASQWGLIVAYQWDSIGTVCMYIEVASGAVNALLHGSSKMDRQECGYEDIAGTRNHVLSLFLH
jgi:hypothetical protein